MPETGLIPDVLPDILPDIILDADARAILLEAARRMGRSPNYVVIVAVSALLGYSSASAASSTPPRKPSTRTSGSFMAGDTLLPLHGPLNRKPWSTALMPLRSGTVSCYGHHPNSSSRPRSNSSTLSAARCTT